MNTREFTDHFFNGEFAKRNLFSHMQIGIPLPILHKEGLGTRLLFHKMSCTEDRICLSAPRFEVCAVYPSGRIYRFSEFDVPSFKTEEIIIPKKKTVRFKTMFEQCFSACDDVFAFYDLHGKVTSIVLKKYYELVGKYAEDFGIEEWYGGLV